MRNLFAPIAPFFIILSLTVLVVLAPFPSRASKALRPVSAPAAAARTGAIKWAFAGAEAGGGSYRINQDGTFQSVTELKILGNVIKSELKGKFVDGVSAEFEMLNTQMGTEVKVVAKDGKASITAGGKTREVSYKPESPVFANLHPILSETILRTIDRADEGVQVVDAFVIDAVSTAKIEVSKKRTRSFEADGRKQIINIYLFRFTSVEFDVYQAQDSRVIAWDIPAQKLQAIGSGFEKLLADPTTLYPELSRPDFKTKSEKGVKVKMRDGVVLTADIVRPAGDGKYPAILERTPYGREPLSMLEGDWWAKRGYVHIVQDVRGRNESQGDWNPFSHERRDGYDTIDWIARQPFSDGNIGMIGGSYLGWVQWAAAVEAHPALKCIVPQVSPPDLFFNFPIDHGVPMLYSTLWWANYVRDRKVPDFPQLLGNLDKLQTLPLSRADDEVLGVDIPYYDQWLERETPSAFAGMSFMTDMGRIKIPIMHISGWWDSDGIGTKLNWGRMRELGHKAQWLIYGPWTHRFNATSRLKDVDYGPDAIMEIDSIYLRWFDHWLKGKNVYWNKQPKVRVFVTGANRWMELEDWPDPRSKVVSLYLSSNGPANGKTSVGALKSDAPRDQEPDRYTYNPAIAVIPKELREMKDIFELGSTEVKFEPHENDVLMYKTDAAAAEYEIGGPIELDLYFSTSAKDTDFFASLVDIDEKGIIKVIGLPGKIRARYISGWENPSLLVPNQVYKTTIAIWDTAHQVKKGHRLGLMINSHMFPFYARNLNTGEPIKSAVRAVAAHQTVYHDKQRPSVLRLRLLPPASVQPR